MKLGLLADIHEDDARLARAIDLLRSQGAERFVMLGDVFDRGDRARLERCCALLDEIDAQGVWGNHDFGLCSNPSDHVRSTFAPGVIQTMSRLRPRLELEGILFTHIEPRLDPNVLEDLWSCGEHPDTPERVDPSFAAVPHHRILMGHIHRWIAATPGVVLPWNGERPLPLERDQRFLIVVHAVADGWCALLDTSEDVLIPVDIDASAP